MTRRRAAVIAGTLLVAGAALFFARDRLSARFRSVRILAVAGTEWPYALHFDGDDVCWSEGEGASEVVCVPRTGGPPRQRPRTDRVTLLGRYVSVDGAEVAVLEEAPLCKLVDGATLFWCSSDALMATSLTTGTTTLLAKAQAPACAAADDAYVYWGERVIGDGDPRDGAIWRVPKQGGSPTQLIASEDPVWGIAVDDKDVYWVVRANSGPSDVVRRVPKQGGGAHWFAVDPGTGTGYKVLVDDRRVYWHSYEADGRRWRLVAAEKD